VSYELQKGIASLDASGDVVVVKLNKTDIDSIKEIRALAMDNSTTFLSMAADAIFDHAENGVTEVSSGAALQVKSYSADSVSPTLLSFDLNMTDGTMSFTFDEVIKALSLNLGEAVLYSGAFESQGLVGNLTSDDGLVITATLSVSSANGLRAVAELAVSNETTFLQVTSLFATDVDHNGVNALQKSDAKRVSVFAVDTVPPVSDGFSIDLSTGKIELRFSQPVNGSSVNVSLLQLQAASNDTSDAVSLSTGVASTELSTTVVITLSETELNDIKKSVTCAKSTGVRQAYGEEPEPEPDLEPIGLGDRVAGCFVAYTSDFVKDSTGLVVVAVSSSDAFQATAYTEDSIRPNVVSGGFTTFDLNTGKIVLDFDEVIDPASFTATGLTLSDDIPLFSSVSVSLTNGTIVETEGKTTLTVQMMTYDLN
jgi:hypothetical protein